MHIRCNFPDISYLSETQKNNFQFLSRPLTYQNWNPNDEEVLAPNHFLFCQIGGVVYMYQNQLTDLYSAS